MKQFAILTKKETLQFIRELKIVWLPLAFIFLGITQPVVTYYLPYILEAFGGGQGIIIDSSMKDIAGNEILASTLESQFDQLGVIIIVISMMGVVQSDKANGMLGFILTRPVKVESYISSKIFSNYMFVAGSVALGYVVSYIYTNFLFTSIPFTSLIVALLFYLLWVLFVVSFTTMVSTFFNSQGVIALISIAVLLGIRMIVGLNPLLDRLNPASMSEYAKEALVFSDIDMSVVWSVLITLLLSAIVMNFAKMWIANKKYNID